MHLEWGYRDALVNEGIHGLSETGNIDVQVSRARTQIHGIDSVALTWFAMEVNKRRWSGRGESGSKRVVFAKKRKHRDGIRE